MDLADISTRIVRYLDGVWLWVGQFAVCAQVEIDRLLRLICSGSVGAEHFEAEQGPHLTRVRRCPTHCCAVVPQSETAYSVKGSTAWGLAWDFWESDQRSFS